MTPIIGLENKESIKESVVRVNLKRMKIKGPLYVYPLWEWKTYNGSFHNGYVIRDQTRILIF